MKTLALALAVMFCGLVVAQDAPGAILGYDPMTSDMPGAGWTLGGGINPISTFYGGGTIAGINVSGGDKGYWLHEVAGLSDSGYTVDFNVLVDSDPGGNYPVVINLYDSGELYQLKLGAQEGFVIVQEGGGTRASRPDIVTNDAYHTYRLVRSGQSLTVYMDANPTAVISASLVNLNNVVGYDRVLFGKGDGSAGGTAALDYLKWNNAAAIMGAPDVVGLPEPASMSLVLLAGGLLLRRKR